LRQRVVVVLVVAFAVVIFVVVVFVVVVFELAECGRDCYRNRAASSSQ
jgi:phosphotransferase system  glucose/maltose/N-acetylglucosamine-specific IIC component